MIIYKNKEEATNLIYNFVNKLNLLHLLNEVEKKFLGLDYNINALSLTDGQSINHQLRFYHMNFGIELINSIVLKIINYIDNKNLEINTYFLKEPEHFFVNRLLELKDKTTKIEFFYDNTTKLEELDYSVEGMNYYLNKGDNWSGIEIAEKLLTHKNSEYNTLEIYHKLALAYHSVNNSLASENLLKKIIEKECDNDEFINQKKISALYILSMLYLRHHPASFLNIDKATNYLNTAYDLLNDPNLKHPDRDFTSIFNRNGYALVLFKKGKVEECIALLDTKINELSTLIQKGKDYLLLHKTVLMYNLYQCYEKKGQLDKAESTLSFPI